MSIGRDNMDLSSSAMGNGCDVVALVQSAAEGSSEECWTAVHEITEDFWGPIEPGHAVDLGELDQAEERLGVRLPAALREVFLRFGRLPSLSVQDSLSAPSRLSLADGEQIPGEGTHVVFRWENQGCAWWSCEVDGQPDPLVHICGESGAVHPDAGTVSQFLVFVALTEMIFAGQHLAHAWQWPEPPEAVLTPLALPSFAWWPEASEPTRQKLYGAAGLIVVEQPDILWAAASSQERLEHLRAAMPTAWQTPA